MNPGFRQTFCVMRAEEERAACSGRGSGNRCGSPFSGNKLGGDGAKNALKMPGQGEFAEKVRKKEGHSCETVIQVIKVHFFGFHPPLSDKCSIAQVLTEINHFFDTNFCPKPNPKKCTLLDFGSTQFLTLLFGNANGPKSSEIALF